MPEPGKIWAVIPAAGIGTRMQADVPKQYLKIKGKCLLEYTLERFCSSAAISAVVVALAKNDNWWPGLGIVGHEKLSQTTGGVERCHSVLNGLRALTQAAADDWVLVHDAARPCLRPEDMNKLITEVSESGKGGLLAIPVRDTMKRADDSNQVIETVDRIGLWHALTPQMFRLDELTRAIESALEQGRLVTDEAQAMEYKHAQPILVEGHADNIKVTRPRDLILAELYLSQQERTV